MLRVSGSWLAILLVTCSIEAVTIRGTVTAGDGSPVEGAEIRLYSDYALGSHERYPDASCGTDAGGAYECHVATGEYHIVAFPPEGSGYAFQAYPGTYPQSQSYELVSVPVVGSLDDIDFHLEEGGRVRFRLVTEEGLPPEFPLFVGVSFRRPEGGFWPDQNNADWETGWYVSETLPSGRYLMVLGAFNAELDIVEGQGFCGVSDWTAGQEIEIAAGQEIDLGTCQLLKAEYMLSGRVVDESGEGVAGTRIRAHPNGDWFTVEKGAETDLSGSFSMRLKGGRYSVSVAPLTSGSHAMTAFPPGTSCVPGSWPTIVVDRDIDGLEIPVESAGGRVSVRFRDPDASWLEGPIEMVIAGAGEDGCFDWFAFDAFDLDLGRYTSPVVSSGEIIAHYRFPDRPDLADRYLCDRRFAFDSSVIGISEGVVTDVPTCRVSMPTCDSLEVLLPGDVPLDLVRIPSGTFLMGTPDDELVAGPAERPQHEVTLTKDYYIGRFELTQSQWLAVVGSYPPHFFYDMYLMFDELNRGRGPNFPIYRIDWVNFDEPGSFIHELNQLATSGNLPWAGRFRLPTEAEWERAARGGTSTPFFWGDPTECDPHTCDFCEVYDRYMHYCGNRNWGYFGPQPVGRRRPNAFGLYDVSGNMYEVPADGFSLYSEEPVTDPFTPVSDSRTIRGGPFDDNPWWNKTAVRFASVIRDDYHPELGFRLAMSWPLGNNQTAPSAGALRVAAVRETVVEGGGNAVFLVSRSGGSDGAVSVTYRTTGRTATIGDDFEGQEGTLSWHAGELGSKRVEVAIVDDAATEYVERFAVVLEGATGGAYICDAFAEVRIIDPGLETRPSGRRVTPTRP